MELIRLEASHLRDLMRLKETAHWNQTEDDWLRCLRLDPDGCIGISEENVSDANRQIVSSATRIRYDEQLSWIGMVLTLPEFRGQGLARRLMEHLLNRAVGSVIRLDASDMGKSLYDSLGFVDECLIERWVRDPQTVGGPGLPPAQIDLALDREVFGADRSELLLDLARVSSAGCNTAYAFARPGSNYYFFGPCVAENPADAEELFQWFVGRYGSGATCIDLFPRNPTAAKLARGYGFKPARTLTRMVLRPASPQVPDSRIIAGAGFEFG
jgi:GNAT superfamily N-acetyltransferase